MKRTAKIALISLLSVGFVTTATGTGFALWASIQKEDTSASFDEVHYTVKFFRSESDKNPIVYENLEIDSSFSLPWIEDTPTQHFKGWKELKKESSETIVYTESLKLVDLSTFDRANKTLSLYAVYDPILTIAVSFTSPKTIPPYSTSVIIDSDSYLYLLSNLAVENEFIVNSIAYKLASFSSATALKYKELQSNGEWSSDKNGTKFGINDGLVLDTKMKSSTLALTANYVEVLG